MKRLFIILVSVLLTANVFAQAPNKMSYQAVIRNNENNLVINTQIGMKISILQGSADGTAIYVETQIPTTNANGLVSIEIGSGTVESGDFAIIDWANDTYFIKTETDPMGGSNYTITGVSQLLSVPYALHAKTAENVTNLNLTGNEPAFDNWDKDATDDFDGDYNSLTNTPTIPIVPSNVSEFTNDAGYVTENTQLTETEVDAMVENNGYLTSETDPNVPNGSQPGDMQYWNGTSWIIIPATQNHGATLQMINGIPTWVGGVPMPTEGLVAYYPFNANANDESGNGNHGTVNGAVLTEDRHGYENRAYYFNGGYITGSCSNFPTSNEARTISVWVKPTEAWNLGFSGYARDIFIYGSSQSTAQFLRFWKNDQYIAGIEYVSESQLPYIFSEGFNLNEWYHCVFTFDGSEGVLYINGNIVASNDINLESSDLGSFIIGRAFPEFNFDNFFRGNIDDIRIYNRVLSEEEIGVLYNE